MAAKIGPYRRARERAPQRDWTHSARPAGANKVNLNIPNIDPTVIALLIPIIVLEVGLLIAAVIDLLRDDRAVRGGNKGLWAVIIVFVNLIGPVLYFLVGRVDGVPEDTTPAPGAAPGGGSPHDPPVAGRATPHGTVSNPAGTVAGPGAIPPAAASIPSAAASIP